jgi:adenine-specific DNA methylase
MSDKRPIEITFPIEQVNEIAEKEGNAKRYYRPVYAMHKWWARRLGSVFRTILLYTLADDEITVNRNGQQDFGELAEIERVIESIS